MQMIATSEAMLLVSDYNPPPSLTDCICLHVCMYVCMSICMSICMYVCMYVYVCVCVCVYVSAPEEEKTMSNHQREHKRTEE
jgi:hypothetical protein